MGNKAAQGLNTKASKVHRAPWRLMPSIPRPDRWVPP